MKTKKVLVLLVTAFALISFLSSYAQVKQDSTRQACQGITAKGIACKSTFVLDNGYCRVHNPDKITCSGTTTAGQPCKRIVSHTGDLCATHAKLSEKDLTLFPNYEKADKEFGMDNRYSDQWVELASQLPSRPRYTENRK